MLVIENLRKLCRLYFNNRLLNNFSCGLGGNDLGRLRGRLDRRNRISEVV